MKTEFLEMWVTSQTLMIKVQIWGSDGAWRVKRYLSVPIADIPEEVLVSLTDWLIDQVPEEDHHQTALF